MAVSNNFEIWALGYAGGDGGDIGDLPREMELRQKQYEYYCDLLLSFPKADTEAAV